MKRYLLKRLLLIPFTLWAIITLNFFIVQLAPGGPVENAIAALKSQSGDGLGGLSNQSSDINSNVNAKGELYRGASGIDDDILLQIKQQYGFDQPLLTRYFKLLKSYLLFDFGDSYFKGSSVLALIFSKLPVSISLGLWSSILIYCIAVPLGIYKARHSGSKLDTFSSVILVIAYTIPAFLLAILLIILFASANYWQWFPLRGLVSDNFADLSILGKIKDYFWHLCLPITALTLGGIATICFLTKNSFLEEINKQYVLTARAKGLSEHKILYKHVFRNAMLLIISSLPQTFIGIFFTGSLLIEIIFSLNGLGLLGYEAVINRDYPIMFGSLYLFTLIGLIANILSDITYHLIDPRIDFDASA